MTLTQVGVTYDVNVNGNIGPESITGRNAAISAACEALCETVEENVWLGPCDTATIYEQLNDTMRRVVKVIAVDRFDGEMLWVKIWDVGYGHCNLLKWRRSDGRILPG